MSTAESAPNRSPLGQAEAVVQELRTLRRPVSPTVQMILACLITAFILIGYDRFFRSAPSGYVPPIVAAARQYRATLPDAYLRVSAGIKSGALKSKKDVVEALREHARPLADAQDSALAQAIDERGFITNPVAAADLFDRAGNALR